MKHSSAILCCLLAVVWVAGKSLNGNSATEPNSMPIKELENVEELKTLVEEAPNSIIIDFYADWCGPCRRQSEVLANVAKEMQQNEVRIIKVNVDDHPNLAAKFQVASIPALFVVKNQQIQHRQVGLATSQQVVDWLAK